MQTLPITAAVFGVSVSRYVRPSAVFPEVKVEYEAVEATEGPPEDGILAAGDPSTVGEESLLYCRQRPGVFLTQSTASSRKLFAPEDQGAFFHQNSLSFVQTTEFAGHFVPLALLFMHLFQSSVSHPSTYLFSLHFSLILIFFRGILYYCCQM